MRKVLSSSATRASTNLAKNTASNLNPLNLGNKVKGAGSGGTKGGLTKASQVSSNDILAKTNRLQKKHAAWQRYNGDLSLQQWSKRYDQLQINRSHGKWVESFGEVGQRFQTPYGLRIVDNAPAIEIKSGYHSATKFIRRQIIKDSFLQRTMPNYSPLWRFVDEAPSNRLLEKLETLGIRYEVLGR